jgi:hypothetical protein
MDLNYILAREQIELALAHGSIAAGARAAHRGMADRYRLLIEQHRSAADGDQIRRA